MVYYYSLVTSGQQFDSVRGLQKHLLAPLGAFFIFKELISLAVGKQDETSIVRWFPGESDGIDGSGVTTASPPADVDSTEATAREAVDTRVSTLSTRLVASGVLPTGV